MNRESKINYESLNKLLIFLFACHIMSEIKKKLNTKYKNINIIYEFTFFPILKCNFKKHFFFLIFVL